MGLKKNHLTTIKSEAEVFLDENDADDDDDASTPEPSFAHENDDLKEPEQEGGDKNDSSLTAPTVSATTTKMLDPDIEDDDDDDHDRSTSSLGNTTAKGGSSARSHDEEAATPKIAAKEARYVCFSKVLVAFVLMISAAVLGYFSYKFTREEEENEFQTKFLDYADEIARSSVNNAENSFTVLQSFSRTLTSLGNFANNTWPFLTVPDFEVRARDFQDISGAEEVAFAPVVEDKDREAWETYTINNQDWIQRGLDYEYLVSLMNMDKDKKQEEEEEPIAEPGTNMEGFSIINKARPIQEFIWKHAPLTHRAVPETRKGPHVPIWQTYPAPRNSYVVNHNLISVTEFQQLIETATANRTTVLSDVVDNFALFGRAQTIDLDPRSIVVQPISLGILEQQKQQNKPNAMLGFLIVIKKWDVYFDNVLYKGAKPVIVVLQNSCGKAFSYEITGPKAVFLGEGDLHDPNFDDMEVVADFAHDAVVSPCNFTIHIYPTQEMEDDHQTAMPIVVSLVVLCVFGFTSLVFLLYDFFVTKRQKTTLASAQATNRIVNNLFPKAVRERLIQEMEAQDNAETQSLSGHNSFTGASEHKRNSGASAFRRRASTRVTNSTFLNISLHGSNHGKNGNGNNNARNSMVGTSEDIFGSKPIAELFPETTIMFADMVGFTAWSSIREPTQVFTLLETIYHAFDTIAKRRRVFKVETIGDCYVAVAGLPMPRKDHAVVMARFASECQSKMDVLTKNLEASLGPDTGDLCIRVGLHSGPVTAGVLRGEKGRFQLFGDTMNTASRMESTGMRGRIQVSRETARLLTDAGKERWVTEREEKIHAKGKGELQTYWLQVRSGSDNDANSALNMSNHGMSIEPFGSDAKQGGQECAPRLMKEASNRWNTESSARGMLKSMATAAKSKRLIDWNTEILGKLLKQIIIRRTARKIKKKQLGLLGGGTPTFTPPTDISFDRVPPSGQAIDEVKDIISLPHYDPKAFAKHVDPESVAIPETVMVQLSVYIGRIADLYRDNPFHNFEHASHVTMSVTKLMSRIVNPLQVENTTSQQNKILHDHTFGITSDPLTQFACVLSALIHDADHPGVSNSVLVNEKDPLAVKYKDKSVAEQNSVDLAWNILMGKEFHELRSYIYTDEDEFNRFRQILVNIVLATDIMDKELGQLRKARWEKAFNSSTNDLSGSEHLKNDETTSTFSSCGSVHAEKTQCQTNRKATIVLEHLIQASDVSHTMQHWHVYRKWNERLFSEVYQAYMDGRIDKDPSEGWYKGEIGFFDFYIIPLAKKLETCGVFGVSSSEYLGYAEQNRSEWVEKGEGIVKEYLEKYKREA